MTTRFLVNSPLINYILYKDGSNAGTIADGATIGFYADSNHTVNQDVYKDADGTVLYENPITLPQGQVPPIYMQNKIYYIEIRDKNGGLIETIDDYVPNGGSGSSPSPTPTSQPSNFIANGQFTYYYDFSIAGDGSPDGASTFISPSWQFVQDAKTTTKNIIIFPSVANQGFTANPINGFNINSESPQSGENAKDLVQTIGSANTYEGEEITIAFEAINNASTSATIEVILTKNFGQDGSESESTTISTETLTGSFAQYVINYTVPSNSGKTIGNGSFLNISFRFPLGSTCNITMTNILGLPGNVAKPSYPELAYADYLAKTFGSMFQLVLGSTVDEKSNYNALEYIDGQIHADQYFPEISLYPIGKQPPNWLRCDGTSYKPDDKVNDNLTYNRLHDAIGQEFGGGGDLIVTSKDNVLTFKADVGARPNSAYTAGNLGSKVTITTVNKGFDADVSATVSADTVTLTWVNTSVTPNPTTPSEAPYATPAGWIGDWSNVPTFFTPPITGPFTTSITAAGPNAAATIKFNSDSISDYAAKTSEYAVSIDGQKIVYRKTFSHFFEWASEASTDRAMPYSVIDQAPTTPVSARNHILFSIDGKTGDYYKGVDNTIIVPLASSTASKEAYATAFAKAINIPFNITVTLNSAPAAGDYFEPSSKDADFYIWYEVDGAGTDPAVAGKTGIKVEITSGDSTATIATKTVTAANSYSFKVPDQATHLPVIPAGGTDKVAYYIKA